MSLGNAVMVNASMLDPMNANTTGPSYDVVINNVTNVHVRNVTNAPPKDPLISLTVPAIMFACGVFGNLVAILVLARSSRDHKQTVFYRLVGALAITDLFGTCATSPVTLAVYANKLKWVGGQPLCDYEAFMFVFVSCTTIFIIGTMAMDRVLAISCPFFYERHLTYSRAKYYILALWSVAVLMGCLPLLGLGEVEKQFPGTWCFFTFTSEELNNQIYAYGYACIGLFVICLTGVGNVIVTGILLKMRRAAARTMGSTKRNDSELQMMVLMLGVIIVFATCWCPFLIRILINQAHFRQVDVRADLHALRLASLNQILDPWVYILFRREFFKKIYMFIKFKIFGRCTNRNHPVSSVGPRSTPHVKVKCHVVDDVTGNQGDAHAHDDESKYVLLDKTNNCYNELDVVGDAATPSDRSRSSSFRSADNSDSKLNDATEESLLVKRPRCNHHHGLEMRHSACLFCFSNMPRTIAQSSAENSRSLSKLNTQNKKGGQGHGKHEKVRDPLHMARLAGKRKSLHLSLEDLGGARA